MPFSVDIIETANFQTHVLFSDPWYMVFGLAQFGVMGFEISRQRLQIGNVYPSLYNNIC